MGYPMNEKEFLAKYGDRVYRFLSHELTLELNKWQSDSYLLAYIAGIEEDSQYWTKETFEKIKNPIIKNLMVERQERIKQINIRRGELYDYLLKNEV